MLWPKKKSYKEFDHEKKSCGSKIMQRPKKIHMREMLTKETPPSTFLMVRGETMLAQDKRNFHASGKNRTHDPPA